MLKVDDRGRSVAHVLGGLLKRHYPGLVRRPATEAEVPAMRWSDYKLKTDVTHGTKYDAVLHEFWVSHRVCFVNRISSN